MKKEVRWETQMSGENSKHSSQKKNRFDNYLVILIFLRMAKEITEFHFEVLNKPIF